MRKYSGSIIIKIILGAIVLVFVFWGAGSFRDNKRANMVAEVDGKPVSIQKYQTVYDNLIEQYKRKYGSPLNDELIKNFRIKENALNIVIEKALLIDEAEKLGLRVSDEELLEKIEKNPTFQKDGVFDAELYKNLLRANRLTPESFEADYKENLIIEKVIDTVTKSVKISEEEVRNLYNFGNASLKIEYALFDFSRYKNVQASDEDIKKYFEENKEKYKTEPEIKAKYFCFDTADYKKDVTNSDEELLDYYNTHIDKYSIPEKVEARHILFKLDKNADEKKVLEKREEAVKVMNMAKNGADFAELAKKYSDGPSAEKGGFLGSFTQDVMVKPFADKAFSMKVNEISEPVRTEFGWHIIKVDKIYEAKTKPFEEVKNEIDESLKERKAKTIAFDKAEAVYSDIFNADTLEQVANSRKAKLFETDYFTLRKGPEKIEDSWRFANTAFKLKKGELSEIKEFNDKYFIIKVEDEKPSQIPQIEGIKDRILSDLLDMLKENKAEADAKSMLAEVKSNDNLTFSKLSRKYNVSVNTTNFFKRNEPISGIGFEKELSEAVFNFFSVKNVYCEAPIKGQSGYYIIKFLEKKDPDKKEFDKVREEAVDSFLIEKKQKAFIQWISELRNKSKIKIYKNL